MMSAFNDDKTFVDEAALRASNFSASVLRQQGYSLAALKSCCFSASELKEAGYESVALRCAGFDAEEQRLGGFSCADVFAAGFSHIRLRLAGYTALDLCEGLHLSVEELKNAGFTAAQIRKATGVIASELKTAGFSALACSECATPGELLRAGFTKAELKPIGAWLHDGEYSYYNSYWSCCLATDRESQYCSRHP